MPRGDIGVKKRVVALEAIVEDLVPRVDTLFQQNENLLTNPWSPLGSWVASTDTPNIADADTHVAGSSYIAADANATFNPGGGIINVLGGDLMSKNAAGLWFKSAGIGSVIAGLATVALARATLDVMTIGEIEDRQLSKASSNALVFDGVNDEVDCGSSTLLEFGDASTDTPFSIYTRVKFITAGVEEPLVAKATGSAPNNEYQLKKLSGDTVQFDIMDSSSANYLRVVTNAAVTIGEWIDIIATYDGGSVDTGMNLYINGIAVAQTQSNNAYTAMHAGSGTLDIAKHSATFGEFWCSRVLIFNRELTAAQSLRLNIEGLPETSDQWGNDTEILSDPGFESWATSSNLDSWNEGGSITVAQDAVNFYSGTYGCHYTSSGSAISSGAAHQLRQGDLVPVGANYVSVIVKNASAGTFELGLNNTRMVDFDGTTLTEYEAGIIAQWAGSAIYQSRLTNLGSGWFKIEVWFKLAGTAAAKDFVLGGTGQWYIDDASNKKAGCVLSLLPENIEIDGNWVDATSNRLNGTNTGSTPLVINQRLDLDDTNAAADEEILSVGSGFNVQTGGDTFVRQLRLGGLASYTIATGAITIVSSRASVDTEGATGTDDLDTISGQEEGAFLVLQCPNNSRTVVCKDGTGNLLLAGDFSLTHSQDRLFLMYDSSASSWIELSRSNNET